MGIKYLKSMAPEASTGKHALTKISHGKPMRYHGKSWDAKGITPVAMGIPINPYGIPWKTMVRCSKPWDTHNMPWESWDAMGITLVVRGNEINPWGIPWKTMVCYSIVRGYVWYVLYLI
jgi:hypothetical protein